MPEVLIASKKVMERVSPEDLLLIKQAAKETCEFEIQKWKEREQAAEKTVRANGNRIIELSPSAYAEFQNAMQPLYEKYGSDYTSVINSIKSTN